MIFLDTGIQGAYLLEVERRSDSRGYFARAWCADELASRGLSASFVQANMSQSVHAGTVRGLHYQTDPHAENKLVRCTRGAIFDVLVDLRPVSPTFLHWFGAELSAENQQSLYVPEGCAHGYQALTDGAEAFYHTTAIYVSGAERGVRFDDPAVAIRWPQEVTVVSEKDRSWPFLLRKESRS
jgi:dTDP-4-dehydrorhamnose 3,5-epimerase